MKTSVVVIVFGLSLAANVVLATRLVRADLFGRSPEENSASQETPGTGSANAATVGRDQEAATGNTSARASRENHFPAWAQLYSGDLPGLIASLRGAGFSEAMVRGALGVLVDEQLEPRRRELLGALDDQPYWRNTNSTYLTPESMTKRRQFRREREDMLTGLLGATDVAQNAELWREYSFLPESKIAETSRIESDYRDLEAQIRGDARNAPLPEDAEKLALLARERRADLAAILTPEELEQFDLYRSDTSQRLRSRLGLFEPTEQEFRDIFELQRVFDDRYAALPTFGGAAAQERRLAQQALDEQMKSVLGEQRFAEFQRGSDRAYQTAVRIIDHFQLPAENATAVYELPKAIETAHSQILRNSSASLDERIDATNALLFEASVKLANLLTAEGAQAYKQSGGFWLLSLEEEAKRLETQRAKAAQKPARPPGGG